MAVSGGRRTESRRQMADYGCQVAKGDGGQRSRRGATEGGGGTLQDNAPTDGPGAGLVCFYGGYRLSGGISGARRRDCVKFALTTTRGGVSNRRTQANPAAAALGLRHPWRMDWRYTVYGLGRPPRHLFRSSTGSVGVRAARKVDKTRRNSGLRQSGTAAQSLGGTAESLRTAPLSPCGGAALSGTAPACGCMGARRGGDAARALCGGARFPVRAPKRCAAVRHGGARVHGPGAVRRVGCALLPAAGRECAAGVRPCREAGAVSLPAAHLCSAVAPQCRPVAAESAAILTLCRIGGALPPPPTGRLAGPAIQLPTNRQ